MRRDYAEAAALWAAAGLALGHLGDLRRRLRQAREDGARLSTVDRLTGVSTRAGVLNCQPIGRPFGRNRTGSRDGSASYRASRNVSVKAMAAIDRTRATRVTRVGRIIG